jgi:RimJ/RimL family protein N-acetyltransferase
MSRAILFHTSRLYFRPVVPEDARLLYELDSDPEVMRFISKGISTPLEKIQNDVMPRVLGYYRAWPPQGFWIAHLRENDDWIGWFHLRPDKYAPEEMEIGYRLKRTTWGRGFATEGSRALVERSFREWGYDKVSARTLIGNLASRRVMEKAGLQFEEEFVWPEDALPGWTENERRGVKYGLKATQSPINTSLQ